MSTTFDPLASYQARALNPERMAAITKHATGSILDVGCGAGRYVLEVPGGRAFGVDATAFPSWDADPTRFVVGDGAALPFADAAFGTVLVFETLEHLATPAAALAEYRRVCNRRIIVTVPNCEITPGMRASNLIYHHWIDPTHRNFFTLESVSALVAAAGFTVAEARLVNRIDLAPLTVEALRLPARAARAARPLVRLLSRPYRMTCLVVADVAPPTGP